MRFNYNNEAHKISRSSKNVFFPNINEKSNNFLGLNADRSFEFPVKKSNKLLNSHPSINNLPSNDGNFISPKKLKNTHIIFTNPLKKIIFFILIMYLLKKQIMFLIKVKCQGKAF